MSKANTFATRSSPRAGWPGCAPYGRGPSPSPAWKRSETLRAGSAAPPNQLGCSSGRPVDLPKAPRPFEGASTSGAASTSRWVGAGPRCYDARPEEMPVRDAQDKEFFSPLDEGERRAGLRRLDDLLLALEELNMREAGEIPTTLKDKLLREGIPVSGNTITELIDVVLGTQDQFMLKERRTGRRRRRLTFVPTDEELVSVISRRYQQ